MDEPIPPSIRAAARRWHVHRHGTGGGDRSAVQPELQAWLDADPRHRRALAQIEGMWDELGRVADTRISQTRHLKKAPFHMRRATHVAFGAGMAAVCAAVLAVSVTGAVDPLALVSPAKAVTYTTGVGEIRKLALDDGSRLVLDTGTRVTVRRTRPLEVTVLAGRARFIVSDRDRQAIVSVPDGEIRAAGGAVFDASLIVRPVQVTTLQGDVHLRASALPTSRDLRVQPRQTGRLGMAGEARPAILGQLRWVDGMLGFDGEPLDAAIAMMNRYNRVQIATRDIDAHVLRVSGAFAANQPEAFAAAIATTFRLDLERGPRPVIILRPRRGD